MALPATDSFTTDTDQAIESYSASWSVVTGVMRVIASTDDVRSDTNNDETCARWNADAFNDDQYSEGTLSGVGSGAFIGVSVRCSASAATYYGYYVDVDETYMFKQVSGSFTQLGSKGTGGSATDVLRLEASGTTITPIKNGSEDTEVGAQTDSAIGSGSAGLCGYWDSVQPRIDDWEGGNLAAASQNATAGFVSSASTAYNATASPGSVAATAGFVASGLSLYDPSAQGRITATATFVSATSAAYDSDGQPGGATVNAGFIASGSAVHDPSASGTVTATAGFIESAVSAHDASAQLASGPQNVTAKFISSGSSAFNADGQAGGVGVTAGFIASDSQLFDATASTGGPDAPSHCVTGVTGFTVA